MIEGVGGAGKGGLLDEHDGHFLAGRYDPGRCGRGCCAKPCLGVVCAGGPGRPHRQPAGRPAVAAGGGVPGGVRRCPGSDPASFQAAAEPPPGAHQRRPGGGGRGPGHPGYRQCAGHGPRLCDGEQLVRPFRAARGENPRRHPGTGPRHRGGQAAGHAGGRPAQEEKER